MTDTWIDGEKQTAMSEAEFKATIADIKDARYGKLARDRAALVWLVKALANQLYRFTLNTLPKHLVEHTRDLLAKADAIK